VDDTEGRSGKGSYNPSNRVSLLGGQKSKKAATEFCSTSISKAQNEKQTQGRPEMAGLMDPKLNGAQTISKEALMRRCLVPHGWDKSQ
jgi:hypothetical protein